MTLFDHKISTKKPTLYNHDQAKDNCGFGLITQLDGIQSHQLIKTSIDALTRMTHRGAVSADGVTGDGCGIQIQLSDLFFKNKAEELGFNIGSRYAIGQIFLSQDEDKRLYAQRILKEELEKETLTVCGWREVPVDESVCGQIAKKSQPNIQQLFIRAPDGWNKNDLERRLFIVRRRAAERIKNDQDYHTCRDMLTIGILKTCFLMLCVILFKV